MNLNRRQLIASASALAIPALSRADNYPSKPLHLVVPYAPGGGLDVFNRPMSIKMGELCGQAVVIDNKAGASGVIGADYVAKAPADGYTTTIGSNELN